MIRINLLPFRLERKKENMRRQVSIFFLSIMLLALFLVWHAIGIKKKIEETRSETRAVKQQILKYKEKADRVTLIKKKLQILEDKLKVVGDLKEKRSEQLNLLEDLPGKIVPDRMWIESLKADAESVVITGVSFDNPTIADFMKNLETASMFSQVDLKRSKVVTIRDDVMLKSFELFCKKKGAETELDGTDKKRKKGK